MKISENYLQEISQLIDRVIPFNICRYYSMIPIGYWEQNPAYILIAMVNPTNITARNTLKKILSKKHLKYKKMFISSHDYQRLLNSLEDYIFKINQEERITQCFRDLDYKIVESFVNNSKEINQLKPNLSDLVLGGDKQKNNDHNLSSSLVLGGEYAIKNRFDSDNLAIKIDALFDSLEYKNLAIQLIKDILEKEEGILIWVAYSLLENINHNETEFLLAKYEEKRKQTILINVDLQGLNLRGIDLQKANLTNANFRGCIINHKTKLDSKYLFVWQIVNQGLKNKNLQEIFLDKVNLQGCVITNTVFNNSLFSFVNLAEGILTQIDLSEATLNNLNLEKSSLKDVNFNHGILQKINFSDSRLLQVNFVKANLSEVNFRGSYLQDIDFSDAILIQVSFYKAIFKNVNFQKANLSQVNFMATSLDNVDFSYLNLSEFKVNFSKLSLINSRLIDVNLTDINLSHSNFYNSDFTGANLSNANLSNSDLTGVNLSNANLRNANLSNANLTNTNLSNADLSHTKLNSATYNQYTIFPYNFNSTRIKAVFNN